MEAAEGSALVVVLDLEGIKARETAATPGSWVIEDSEWSGRFDVASSASDLTPGAPFGPTYPGVAERLTEVDATFIAHARTDIPALLAEVDRLKWELIQARQDIKDLRSAISKIGLALGMKGPQVSWNGRDVVAKVTKLAQKVCENSRRAMCELLQWPP